MTTALAKVFDMDARRRGFTRWKAELRARQRPVSRPMGCASGSCGTASGWCSGCNRITITNFSSGPIPIVFVGRSSP